MNKKCETDLVRDVVHYYDTVGPSVITGRDGPEPLLACRVPLERWRHTERLAGSNHHHPAFMNINKHTLYWVADTICNVFRLPYCLSGWTQNPLETWLSNGENSQIQYNTLQQHTTKLSLCNDCIAGTFSHT